MRPGRRNLITDVAGLRVGNASDDTILTGVTVVVPDAGMVAAADVRGGAPGNREVSLLEPETLVEEIHGLVLAGGSVFGLDAASQLTLDLARRGIGFRFGTQAWPCPVVPAAILFDLANGGDKRWDEPPYRRLAGAALAAAAADFALGNAGAGAGAIAGAVKGGLGSASATADGVTVGALVVVNSVGACFDPATGLPWAAAHAVDDEMGPLEALPLVPPQLGQRKHDTMAAAARPGANTTIAVVATDARLSKAEAKRVAIMATDGLAIAIRPLHTPFDGDTVFAVSTGRTDAGGLRPLAIARIGELAALTLARACGRALWQAGSAGHARSWRDLAGI